MEDDSYARNLVRWQSSKATCCMPPPGSQAIRTGGLTTDDGVPTGAFDCIILTQTLPFIYDIETAIHHAYRRLRPSGVLLLTLPFITRISRPDMDRWGDYWRLTSLSMR